jgi:ABC-type dipeptide/oligopeptide/nickel transport system permease subunit
MSSSLTAGGAGAPRGPWRSAWGRLRHDRWSLVALCFLALILVSGLVGGAVVTRLVGHNGVDPFPYATNTDLRPAGPWAHVPVTRAVVVGDYGQLIRPAHARTTLFVLGADGPLGRDELIRLLDAARTSLLIGIGAMLVALIVALPIGVAAGYFGGATDAVVSRFTEIVMAFPLLLVLIFASARLSTSLQFVSYSWVVPRGVSAEALLIGLFTSFYPTRLIRSQLQILRTTEFVEASHMVGASNRRIMWRHLLPHVVPVLLVWAAIAVGTNILLEVGLSFIGIGVPVAAPTLGSLLSTPWGTISTPHPYNGQYFTPWQTIFPTLAILITVVSLNQLSEGVRRAIEPWSRP